MAVNSQKFLPSSTRGGSIVKSSSAIVSASKISSRENKDTFLEIKVKVIEIDKILKGTLALKKKQLDDKKKSENEKGRKKQEEKLERKPKDDKDKIKLPGLPRTGFLDGIKNFIGKILLGYFAYRLIEHLPKILPIINFIGSASDFIINVGGKLLNGLVSFIDWGYKAYDATRGFMKNMFGEDGAKQFDQLAGLLNQFLNLALIVGMAGSGRPFGGRGGGKTTVSRGGGSGPYKYDPKRALIRKKYGDSFAKLYDQEIAKGLNSEQARKNVLSRYVKKGRITPQRMTGSLGGTDAGSKLFGRGIQKVPGRLATKLLGKNALRIIKPIFKNIPIIGGLIEFGISWALGDPIGKAAFRGIGAGLVGAVGTAIGGPIGMAIGGFVGGEVGGALYDMFFGNKKPQPIADEAQGSAGGGVTRGGKFQGQIKRQIKKAPAKRQIKITPKKLEPGSSIGGSKQIEKIFPKSEDSKTVNPMGYVGEFYDTTSDIPFFGPLFAIATKTLLGDKPTQLDYKNAGSGLNNWMNNTFNTEVMRAGFAGGGEVNAEMFIRGEDLTDAIAKSLEDNISKKIEDAINDLQKQLGLKEIDRGKKPGEGPGAEDEPTGSPSLVGNSNAEKVFRYLVDKEGFTPEAAAGVIGNLMQESGVNPKSRQLGGGPGRGIMQWTESERWASLSAWASNSGKDPWALETQVEWMIKEMKSYGTYNRIKGVSSYKKAVEIFEREMERAGVPNYPRRYQFAADALASFSGGAGGSGAGGSYTDLTNNPDAKRGSKLAGELGRFLDKKGVGKFGSGVHQHPEHPPWSPESGHSPGSLHYASKGARAIDIGGYGRSRGYSDQDQILAAISEFNKMKGVKPVQLLKDGYPGHDNHVHVAYAKGGLVDGVTYAMLGERGREFVIDADSTAALEQKFPGFLDALNKANYDGAINVLRSYTDYERSSSEIVFVPVEVPNSDESYSTPGSDLTFSGGGEQSSPFSTLYEGG